MGIYAQTDITIECKDQKVAKKVYDLLVKHEKEEKDFDGQGVFRIHNLGNDGSSIVYGLMHSGRIQNLGYQIETLWEFIKDIDGVLELHAPVMSEVDGFYFSNE